MSDHQDLATAFFNVARRSHRPASINGHSPWVWPLPVLNGGKPIVFDHWTTEMLDPPESFEQHPRLLLSYDRGDFANYDYASIYPIETLSGMLLYFLPRFTPVFAAQDGTITYAGKADGVNAMTIVHGDGWATHYANLQGMLALPLRAGSRRRGESVQAGDVLGFVGGTTDNGQMRPLRFELWRKDGLTFKAEDPKVRMETWLYLPHHDRLLASAYKPKKAA